VTIDCDMRIWRNINSIPQMEQMSADGIAAVQRALVGVDLRRK